MRKGAARARTHARAGRCAEERARSGRLVPRCGSAHEIWPFEARRVACLRSGLAQAEESAALCRAPPFSGRGGLHSSQTPERQGGSHLEGLGGNADSGATPLLVRILRVGLHEISVFLLLLIRLRVACGRILQNCGVEAGDSCSRSNPGF